MHDVKMTSASKTIQYRVSKAHVRETYHSEMFHHSKPHKTKDLVHYGAEPIFQCPVY